MKQSTKKYENKVRKYIALTSLSENIVGDSPIEKMEAALSLWIQDRNQVASLNRILIREKAKRLYTHSKESDEEGTDGGFQVSVGSINER